MARTANVKGGLLAQQQEQTKAVVTSPLKSMLSQSSIQARFNKLLGDEAEGFISSILTVCNDNKLLRNADPRTILSAAATAASLKLAILPTLGKAYIVPYKGAAGFQIGYKGVIELAQRTGKMKFITACPVYEGEITKWDKFTETIERGDKVSDKIIGYYASFQLLNGFTKTAYWTVDEVKAHAKRFSKAYSSGPWVTDFDAMACKTVLLSILKVYAPMSVKMQEAVASDGEITTINDDGEVETFDVIEAETEQVEPTEPTEVPADFEVPDVIKK